MARPSKIAVTSGTPGWDAVVNQNLDILFDGPLPLFRASDLTDLETNYLASQYEQCVAITEDTGVIYVSDGADWNRLVPEMPYDGSPSATTLRDALVTAGLMAAS